MIWVLSNSWMETTAERLGVQLPRARCVRFYQKTGDLAREAVSWNALFGGNAVQL